MLGSSRGDGTSPLRAARGFCQVVGARGVFATVATLVSLVLVQAASAELPSILGSAALRREAANQVPWDQLTPETVAKLKRVVDDPTIFRRMPDQQVACDPDLYVFLVRHPEVIVNMWQLMGVTRCSITRTGDYTFTATDGAGTQSHVELVYGTRNLHVIYAEGFYEGPMLARRVTGRCVMILSAEYGQDEQQSSVIGNRMDVFLQLDNVGVELVARTLHPVMGKTADTNFIQSANFVGQVSRVAESNATGMQRMVMRLENVQPMVRNEFARLSQLVSQRAAQRQVSAAAATEVSASPLEALDSVRR